MLSTRVLDHFWRLHYDIFPQFTYRSTAICLMSMYLALVVLDNGTTTMISRISSSTTSQPPLTYPNFVDDGF